MRRCLVPLLALFLAVTGCTGSAESPSEPEPTSPLTVAWRELRLPVPPGPPGRLGVRDAVKCDGQWYVVGGIFLESGDGYGESRPAAWRSSDGETWEPLRLAPQGYWAHRAVFASIACRDGEIALVGAKAGGAHGNPRVTTWYQRPDGVYTDVQASFELYGGPSAVSVGRIAAGDNGWMIVGNRTGGGAVWISPDARDFTLIDSDPQLASDPQTDTAAVDLTYADGGWTAVGNAQTTGRVARVPMAWASADGRSWQRQKVPYGDGYTDLHRVIAYRDGVLAAGLQDDTFGVWRRTGDTWRGVGGFGKIGDGAASPFVSSLTAAGDGVVATVSDTVRYQLWGSADGGARWRPIAAPVSPAIGGERVMTAVGSGDELMLIADDGAVGRAWLAESIDYR